MGILQEIHEEEVEKLEAKIKKLEAKIKKLEAKIKELEKKTGYSTSLAGCECNNCGYMDRD